MPSCHAMEPDERMGWWGMRHVILLRWDGRSVRRCAMGRVRWDRPRAVFLGALVPVIRLRQSGGQSKRGDSVCVMAGLVSAGRHKRAGRQPGERIWSVGE